MNKQIYRIKPCFKLIQTSKLLFAVLLLLCSLQLGTSAQDRSPSRGVQFANSYASNGFDSVNVSNGNVVINLPIASLPAGRGPGFTVTLQYNSKLWDSRQEIFTDAVQPGSSTQPQPLDPTYRYSTNTIQYSDRGGWKLLAGYRIIETDRLDLESPNPCLVGDPVEKLAARWKLEVEFPDGTVRQFTPTYYSSIFHSNYYDINSNGLSTSASTQSHPGNGLCYVSQSEYQGVTSGMHYTTTDGSRLRLFIPYHASKSVEEKNWKIYSTDGTTIENLPPDDNTVSQRITDRNNNKVEIKGSIIVDDFGRSITIGSDEITVKGIDGEDITTQIVYGNRWVNRPYQITGHDVDEIIPSGIDTSSVVNTNIQTIEEIILPTQLGSLSYTFDYYAATTQQTGTNYTDGWGELKSMTIPSGATSTYEYQMSTLSTFAADVLDNKATQRTLSFDEVYDGVSTPRTEVTTYTSNQWGSVVSNPDGTGFNESRFYNQYFTDWTSGLTYSTTDTSGKKVESIWAHNMPHYSNNPYNYGSAIPGNANAFIKTEFTSITDSGGSPYLTAIKDYKYDKNGNVTKITEYDWVAYSSVPREYTRPTGIPSGATVMRVTENEYYNPAPDFESNSANANTYENPSAPKLKNVLKSTQIKDGSGNIKSRSEFLYDDPNDTGNLIETRVWDSNKGGSYQALTTPLTDSNSVKTQATYNAYGMPLTTTDANGTVTQITYGNIAGPDGNVTDLYPTQTIAAYGTALARTSTATYDFYTGLVMSATDEDNDVTVVTEYDDLGRPVKVRNAYGTALESWTTSEYDNVNRRVVVKSDLAVKGDGKKVAIQHFDQLGRVRLARTLEDPSNEDPYDEQDGIKVQTRYLTTYSSPNGFSYQLSSNPYRAATSTAATGEETMGWTRSKAWHTGKKSEVETFSGAAFPAPWGANSNSTGIVRTDIDAERSLVTDQAGKQRISKTNALGQLKEVWEILPTSQTGSESITFPGTSIAHGFKSTYNYDTLGKMVHVQQGVQHRYFMHDSLGRLLRVRQPEQEVNSTLNTSGNPSNNSWTIGYTYDNNGNVLTTRDANNVLTTMTYDAMNRQLTRSYSDTTPTVTYTYDETAHVPNSKGQLTKITSSISEVRYTEYDKTGRLITSEQRTDGEVYPSEYKYNLAGMLIEQTYPSGRVVKNLLDNSGDISIIQSKKNENFGYWNYASHINYTASGVIKHLQLGNGLWESAVMNSRNQVLELRMGNSPTNAGLMKLEYAYGEFDGGGSVDITKNAGNIVRQTVSFDGLANPFVQEYKYDALDRITEAQEKVNSTQTWIQQFGYDRYGNRTSLSQDVLGNNLTINEVTLPSVDTNTNRFTSTSDYEYDAVGNLIQDTYGRQFTFNGDNKQVEVKDQYNNPIGEYVYDGNGKRIKKITASEYVIFVYDGLGKLIGEYSTDGPSNDPMVHYTATDPLGSPRVLTNENGEVLSRRDFMPFGEEIGGDITYRTTAHKYGVGDSIRQKFTGYEHDEETGLDFAEARYYYNNHGRFTAVDPLLASGKSADPQTFNRYAYVLNRPLTLVDPTGLQTSKPIQLIQLPPKVTALATQRTQPLIEEGASAVLPKSMIELKMQLANIAYQGEAEIANINRANLNTGSEMNPERSIERSGSSTTESTSNKKEVTAGVDVSTEPSINVKVGESRDSSSSNSVAVNKDIEGPVTNTVALSKQIDIKTNTLIVNYLNKNVNSNDRVPMTVEYDNSNKKGKYTISRQSIHSHLTSFVNEVRQMAHCDIKGDQSIC